MWLLYGFLQMLCGASAMVLAILALINGSQSLTPDEEKWVHTTNTIIIVVGLPAVLIAFSVGVLTFLWVYRDRQKITPIETAWQYASIIESVMGLVLGFTLIVAYSFMHFNFCLPPASDICQPKSGFILSTSCVIVVGGIAAHVPLYHRRSRLFTLYGILASVRHLVACSAAGITFVLIGGDAILTDSTEFTSMSPEIQWQVEYFLKLAWSHGLVCSLFGVCVTFFSTNVTVTRSKLRIAFDAVIQFFASWVILGMVPSYFLLRNMVGAFCDAMPLYGLEQNKVLLDLCYEGYTYIGILYSMLLLLLILVITTCVVDMVYLFVINPPEWRYRYNPAVVSATHINEWENNSPRRRMP